MLCWLNNDSKTKSEWEDRMRKVLLKEHQPCLSTLHFVVQSLTNLTPTIQAIFSILSLCLCSYLVSFSTPHVLLVWSRGCLWGTLVCFLWPSCLNIFKCIQLYAETYVPICCRPHCLPTYPLTPGPIYSFILWHWSSQRKAWFIAKGFKDFYLLLATMCFLAKVHFANCLTLNQTIIANTYGLNEWSFFLYKVCSTASLSKME